MKAPTSRHITMDRCLSLAALAFIFIWACQRSCCNGSASLISDKLFQLGLDLWFNLSKLFLRLCRLLGFVSSCSIPFKCRFASNDLPRVKHFPLDMIGSPAICNPVSWDLLSLLIITAFVRPGVMVSGVVSVFRAVERAYIEEGYIYWVFNIFMFILFYILTSPDFFFAFIFLIILQSISM